MRACHGLLKSAGMMLVLLLATVLGQQSVSAQGRVADYRVDNFTGDFNSISSTGNIWYWYNVWSSSYAMTLPFEFKYDNSSIASGTTIYVTSSGALSFTGSFPSYGNNTGQGSASYPQLLSFLGGSLSSGNRHNGYYDHYYQTSGVSPNRVFTVEIRNIHLVCAANGSGSGPQNYMTHVQVKLYETSGVIEYIYSQPGRGLGSNCFSAPSIGLNGRSSPSFSTKTVASNVTSVPSSHIRFTPPPPPAQLSVQPKSLSFGNVDAGSPVQQCVTVRSVGTNPLVLNGASISGGADYQIVSGPAVGTTLTPGQSANYCVSFNPIASGTRTATLTITSNGADSGTQAVSLTGFGIASGIDVPVKDFFRKVKLTVGDSTTVAIGVRSTGTGALIISSLQLNGGDDLQYSIKRAPAGSIPVGQSDSIYVTFRPTFEGRHDATLIINNNSINAPQVTVRMYGIAIMPRLSITPMNLSFDSVLVGQTVCKELTLANPGTDTVNILRVIQTFSDKDFTFTPLSPSDTMIRPEEQKTYRICFTPRTAGTRIARLTFYSDLIRTFPDGRDTSQFTVNIEGVGVPFGRLLLSGTVTNSAVVGTENCVTDSIRNTGSADFTITGAALTGANMSEYSFSGLSLPVTLKAGRAIPFSYCVTPTERGLRDASIVLSGVSSGEAGSATLPLNGIGIQVCAKTDLGHLFDEMTPVGLSDTMTVTVTNCGDLATTYTATLGSGSATYTILGAATSPEVAAGETTTFTVVYKPTAIGANSASLTITGNGPGSTPMIVALNGVGAGVAVSATGGNAGNVVFDECEDFTVTLTNNGNVDWTPGAIQVTGTDAAKFTFVSLNPLTISAGGTATLTLRYCPVTQGSSTATISFPNSVPEPLAAFTYNVSGNGVPTGGVEASTSRGFVLGQNHPNPLKSSTSFRVVIPTEAMVKIDLFDQTGAFVRNVVSERMSGERTIELDATMLASGTYSYVLTSGDVRIVRQLTIVH